MGKVLGVFIVAGAFLLASVGVASAAQEATPTYVPWNPSAAGNPHSNYQTATTKCAVCHAVHNAPAAGTTGTTGGYPWTASAPTEMLLRNDVAEACRFCHIDTAIGGVQLYGLVGGGSTYGDGPGQGYPGHMGFGDSECVLCHSVHGADTLQGANASKILKYNVKGRGPQPEVINGGGSNPDIVPAYDNWTAALYSSNYKYTQQMVLCTICHTVYTTSPDATINLAAGDPSLATKGHAFVNPSSSFTEANAGYRSTLLDQSGTMAFPVITTAYGASALATPVAFTNTLTCRSCHDAGGVDGSGVQWASYPHYSQGTVAFLSSGPDRETARAVVNANVAGNSSNGGSENSSADGVCLKCHRSSAGSRGVGWTY